jgi:hypothetical protein
MRGALAVAVLVAVGVVAVAMANARPETAFLKYVDAITWDCEPQESIIADGGPPGNSGVGLFECPSGARVRLTEFSTSAGRRRVLLAYPPDGPVCLTGTDAIEAEALADEQVAGGCAAAGGELVAADRLSARLRSPIAFVGTPVVTRSTWTSPTSGRSLSLGATFRLTRTTGPTARGNARAGVQIESERSEFVSRIGRRRVACYAGAPSGHYRLSAYLPGKRVHVMVTARGVTIGIDAPVLGRADAGREIKRLRCDGRKQRG